MTPTLCTLLSTYTQQLSPDAQLLLRTVGEEGEMGTAGPLGQMQRARLRGEFQEAGAALTAVLYSRYGRNLFPPLRAIDAGGELTKLVIAHFAREYHAREHGPKLIPSLGAFLASLSN